MAALIDCLPLVPFLVFEGAAVSGRLAPSGATLTYRGLAGGSPTLTGADGKTYLSSQCADFAATGSYNGTAAQNSAYWECDLSVDNSFATGQGATWFHVFVYTVDFVPFAGGGAYRGAWEVFSGAHDAANLNGAVWCEMGTSTEQTDTEFAGGPGGGTGGGSKPATLAFNKYGAVATTAGSGFSTRFIFVCSADGGFSAARELVLFADDTYRTGPLTAGASSFPTLSAPKLAVGINRGVGFAPGMRCLSQHHAGGVLQGSLDFAGMLSLAQLLRDGCPDPVPADDGECHWNQPGTLACAWEQGGTSSGEWGGRQTPSGNWRR